VSSNDDHQCYLSNSAVSFLCGLLVLFQGFTVCIALNWYVIVGDYRKNYKRHKSKKKDHHAAFDPDMKNKITRASTAPSVASVESPTHAHGRISFPAREEPPPGDFLSVASTPSKDSNGMSAFLRPDTVQPGAASPQSPACLNPSPYDKRSSVSPDAHRITTPVQQKCDPRRCTQQAAALAGTLPMPSYLSPHTNVKSTPQQTQYLMSPNLPATSISMPALKQHVRDKQEETTDSSVMTTNEEKAQRSRIVGRLLIGSLLLMLMVSVASAVNYLTREETTSEDVQGCGDKYFSQTGSERDNWNAFSFTVVTDLATLVLGGLAIMWALVTFCRVRLLKSTGTQALETQQQEQLDFARINKSVTTLSEVSAPFSSAPFSPEAQGSDNDHKGKYRLTVPFVSPSFTSPTTNQTPSAPQTVDAFGHLKPFDEELPIPGLESMLSQVSHTLRDSAQEDDIRDPDDVSVAVPADEASTGSDYMHDDESRFDLVIKDPRGSQFVRSDGKHYVCLVDDPLICHIYDQPRDIEIEDEFADDRPTRCGNHCIPMAVCEGKSSEKNIIPLEQRSSMDFDVDFVNI